MAAWATMPWSPRVSPPECVGRSHVLSAVRGVALCGDFTPLDGNLTCQKMPLPENRSLVGKVDPLESPVRTPSASFWRVVGLELDADVGAQITG